MQKYLTFDCYGTLLQEEGTCDEIEAVAEKIGVDPQLARKLFIQYQDNRDNLHPYIDYSILTRNNLLHLDYKFNLNHQFEKYYINVLAAQRALEPFSEVVDTLGELINRGYKLILMSNSSWDIIDANAKSLEVPVDIWTAEDVHSYKPDLHFFNTIENEYGLTPDNHWHIAQGYSSDIIPADKLGWPSIWVNRPNDEPTTNIRPTKMVETLDQILEYL